MAPRAGAGGGADDHPHGEPEGEPEPEPAAELEDDEAGARGGHRWRSGGGTQGGAGDARRTVADPTARSNGIPDNHR